MCKQLRRIVRDQRGATAVEYGLIVSLIVIAVIVGVKATATSITSTWNNVSSQIIH
jgi:pilus assembly protein Flp/PilA